ncbi:M48 family metalloprotease [Amycolatopsis sp. H6(2020)]|nr:M48 family metalloprotease [Amycolatopsis sp. H6(2020)]
MSAQIIALAIVAPIVFFLARALMYAQIRLSGVRITPTQFPEAYRMVVEAAEAAGLRRVPDAYVMLGNGQINAFAAGHGHRRFIAVYSDLFEIGGAARDPEALRFIIGHEVGHIAAGHVSYFRLLGLSLFNQIPVLGNILSRAQEYTADNFGYRFCPQGARGQIKVLAAGKYLNADVNFDEFADRAVYERGLFTWLANLGMTHPANTWRAHALRDRSRPGRLIWRPKQNPPREPLSMVPAAEPAASWADPLQAGRFTDAYHPAPENQHWGINATHRWVPVERRDAPVPDLLDTLWVAPGVRRSPVPPQGPAGAGSVLRCAVRVEMRPAVQHLSTNGASEHKPRPAATGRRRRAGILSPVPCRERTRTAPGPYDDPRCAAPVAAPRHHSDSQDRDHPCPCTIAAPSCAQP